MIQKYNKKKTTIIIKNYIQVIYTKILLKQGKFQASSITVSS